MKILVTGGTGTVGTQVVQELLKRKADTSVLTRDAKKPLPEGAKAIEGNLLDVNSVRTVFKGMDAVFLLNPVSQTETSEALMAVTAMRNAGVRRVVYVSVQDADQAAWLPHFGSKVGVEAAVGRVRLPDGSERFVVDEATLLQKTIALGGRLLDPLKTTNVQNQRAMTTWVLEK